MAFTKRLAEMLPEPSGSPRRLEPPIWVRNRARRNASGNRHRVAPIADAGAGAGDG
jgi:hypothetical protein